MEKRQYRPRTYEVGHRLLELRNQTGLTQAELGQLIGVSKRSILKWEGGEGFPNESHLRHMIEVFVARAAFTAGQEYAEAEMLWQQVGQAATRRMGLFNQPWFERLLAARTVGETTAQSPATGGDRSSATETPPGDDRQPAQDGRNVAIGLPFQATPFIGRGAELAEIARILGDPACRLLTLLGPGGIGKTRLALETAARQAGAFTDGVAFVALAAVGTPNQIVSAIGDALGLSFAGQLDPAAHLLGSLRTRHMLLVLDNFEHLLAGADLVYDMLQHAPRVTILVTSRARLNLQAEWLFDVEGLSYPPGDSYSRVASQSLADLADYGAVQLFVQRAAQVQPGLPLPISTLATMVRICQHVAGMPLAIELAAAGVRTLPIAEIEWQIRTNLDMLATTLRDMPVRHRSLRAVFDHSWNLLSEPERILFSRLAVFRGGWTADAAEAVCLEGKRQKAKGKTQDSDAQLLPFTFSLLPLLTALVDKSLVRQEASAEPQSIADRAGPNAVAGPHFFLLEPIREYALEKLAARGEAAALQHAHASYYLALAEAAGAEWDSPAADAGIAQLDREHDNLRAALQWARDGGDPTIGLQLAGALRRFWRRRGYISEGRVWLEELLALGDDTSDPAAMAARLRAMHGAAWLASYQHDFAYAARLFEQSMALRRALGGTDVQTHLLDNAARQARAIGQYQRATALVEDALAQHRAMGDRGSLSTGGLGLSLYEMGLVLREQGDFVRAAALFAECVEFHRALGDREGMAVGLLGLGDIARDRGDVAQMRTYSEESHTILRDLGIQWAIGFALNNLALAAYQEGDLACAFALAEESVSLFRAQKADASLAEVLITLGHILRAQGDSAAAYAALTEALPLAQAIGPRLLVAAALEGLAGVAAQPEQAALAVRLLAAASALRVQMGTPVRPADQSAVEHALATARSTLGDAAFAALWSEASELPLELILSGLPGVAVSSASAAPPLAAPPVVMPAPNAAPPPLAAPPPATPAPSVASSPLAAPPTATPTQRVPTLLDWGEAIDVPALYGRETELATLEQWVLADRCRVVALLGMGGIGKTSLALTFAQQVLPHFDGVLFRSLRNAPPLSSLLDNLIRALSVQQAALPDSVPDKMTLLVELLRERRCLLILDNLETITQAGADVGAYRPGYTDYSAFIQRLGEVRHQSCLLLTSREKPIELGPLEGPAAPVRTLLITGLAEQACQAILQDKDIVGPAADWAALARLYGGNPLALKLVAEPIREVFGGDMAAFLAEGDLFFKGVDQLLDQQIGRLSPIERDVLNWLAIEREPVGLAALRARSTLTAGPREWPQALVALRARHLIERGEGGAVFTLQPVVMEYLTALLIERMLEEIVAGTPDTLLRYAVLLAQAPEYVRQSQERVIAQPLLAQLGESLKNKPMVETQLAQVLAAVRRLPRIGQGYGGGNVLNLLIQFGSDLRGYDFSHMNVWQANLADIELPGVDFRGADLAGSRFTEAFKTIVPVAFSPDGKHLAAGSIDGEILLWRVADNQQVGLFHGHTGPVYTVAFSPDNRILASGSSDGLIILWSLANGARLATLRGHSSRVWSVAFGPDSALLASGSDDQTIKLWSVSTGACLATLDEHHAPVASVAFSPDGALLASGGHDPNPTIKCWDVATRTCVATLSGHTADIWSVAFSPNGALLASGSADLTIRLWSVPTGAHSATLRGHTARIRAMAWGPGGATLASGSLDQTVKLWDIAALRLRAGQAAIDADAASGVCLATLAENTGPVNGVAFSPDGDTLAGGGELQTIALWSVARKECLALLYGYNSGVLALAFTPDGATLASAGFDRTIRLWPTAGHTASARLAGHTGAIYSLAFSPDGALLASGSGGGDRTVRLWSAASSTGLATLMEHHSPVVAVAWSADAYTIASGSLDWTIKLWSPTSPASLATLHGHNDGVRALAFSPDGALLASASYDRTVRLWAVARREPIQTFSGHIGPARSVAFSPDGRLIASGSADHTIRLWSVASGACLAILSEHSGEVVSLAFSVDGALLASGSFDGTVRLWDVAAALDTGAGDACLATLDPQTGVIYALAFSSDGRTFASGGATGLITLWDLPTRQRAATLRGEEPYAGMAITAATGLTDAQRATLRALGAVEP